MPTMVSAIMAACAAMATNGGDGVARRQSEDESEEGERWAKVGGV